MQSHGDELLSDIHVSGVLDRRLDDVALSSCLVHDMIHQVENQLVDIGEAELLRDLKHCRFAIESRKIDAP